MAETYIRKAKNLVKKVLGMNYNLIRSDFDEENSCKSLNESKYLVYFGMKVIRMDPGKYIGVNLSSSTI